MRILYIGFDVEGVGGIATYSRYQIRALKDLGHDLTVLSVDKQDERTRITGGLADHRLPFKDKYRASAAVLGFLARRPRAFDATVINHVFLAGFGLAYRSLGGAPYVLNVYNIDILGRLPRLREMAFARADLVIADCRLTIERMPRFHARVPPAVLLYDPVDVEFFHPHSKPAARAEIERRFGLGDLSERFVLTTVASLLLPPNKGHRQTMDALAQLADSRFIYVVVGDGPDRAALEAYARERGVADQVRFLGLVDQQALPWFYSAADVAILVARGGPGQGEAVPLGLIEASACATAFVCGNEDGSPEAIDPARPNGIAIDPHRPEELAAILRRLADDGQACTAMGANGRQMAIDTFAFPRFTRQLGEHLAHHLGPAFAAAPAPRVAADGI